jgi:chitinase
MKKMRKLFSFILIFSIATLSFIPFTNDITTAQAAGGIYINETNITLEVDHYKTLRIGGTTKKASWSTSNSHVATVSSSGKVFAKAPGSATITAKVGGQNIRCKVNVIYMRENLVLTKNKTTVLTVYGEKKNVTYASSNPSIVTVSDSGKLTAKSTGSVYITANVDGKEINSKVTVVGLNHDSIVLELGGWSGFIKTLKVSGSSSNVRWSTGNSVIATVDKDGRVRAKGPGTTKITATIDGIKLTSTVKVIKASTKEFTLDMGKTKALSILGTNSKVTWDSNKKSVATVSSTGVVSTVSPGTASIYGFVDGRKVTFTVHVED